MVISPAAAAPADEPANDAISVLTHGELYAGLAGSLGVAVELLR